VVADPGDALILAVPVLKVQNSRMVLKSPISRRVGSPAYFLSCGSSPRLSELENPVAAGRCGYGR
jgi:hypothetical protein